INLKTPTAKNTDLNLRAEGGTGYNDISGGLNGIGKLRLDKRFFPSDRNGAGKLGILVSSSYFSNNNAEDRLDATWEGFERPVGTVGNIIMPSAYSFRKIENKRERIGVTSTID